MTTEATPAGAAAPAPSTAVQTPSQEAPAPSDSNTESATTDNPGPDPTETTEAKPQDAPPAPDADKAKAADPAPEKLPPAEKRIAKLTAKLREAERKLEEAAKTAPPADKLGEGDKAPTPDQFKTWDEYEEARVAHLVKQTTRKQEAQRKQEASEKEWTERRATFLAGVERATEAYPDFNEVVMDTDGVFDRTPEGEALAGLVMMAEKSHDVAYHLASNPKEADRIKALNPIQAALAIGRLSASVAAPAPRKVSKTPDPPTTIKGGEVPQKDPKDMSMPEYEAWRKGKKA